ncbi:MAG TPA: N-acetylmuramoyl-L-alanine amidase, partial [Polyangia bacterium]|nr:N-acetylmuramoyl-L-alanine amidase [Polyangia bacterium]
MAATEGGLKLPAYRAVNAEDHVLVAGMLELRHGQFNSLARAAQLSGLSEPALCADTDRATVVGALVLAELGAQTGARSTDLSSWRDALQILSGHATAAQRADYAARVLALARAGGRFRARAGEWIGLLPHAELPPPTELLGPSAPPPGPLDTPEFPGAIWFPTPSANKWAPGRADGNSSVDIIVIHDTEGGWDGSVATLQNDPGKSVHYIVDADGSRVGQFVHETDTAWHAGNSCYNRHSIGIEHVGDTSDPNGYGDGLYETSKVLVQNIRTRWGVPLDRAHMVGHYQVPNGNLIDPCGPACTLHIDVCEASNSYGGANNHRDPGLYWQWCQYMERLGGACTCADAWDRFNCTTDRTEAVRCINGMVEIRHCAQPCVPQGSGLDDLCVDASIDGGGTGGSGGGGGPP